MNRLIGIAGFVLIALLAWWLIIGDYNVERQQKPGDTDYVEAFMNDFMITAMDEQGTPRYVIEGKYFEKRKNQDEARVDKPIIFLKQETPWKVVADTALVNDITNTLHLENNVVMEQQDTDPAITIRTRSLTINTKKQIAYTDAPVTIAQGNSELNSVGLRYDNTTSELNLKSRVHGYLVPDNPLAGNNKSSSQ
jgi:LPS export ABC transporter protein LptC